MYLIPQSKTITPISILAESPSQSISESSSSDFHHVVIDLETLSLRTDAAIVSIGAVALDKNLEVCGQFYCPVEIQSCISHKMRVSASTLRWWLTQDQEVKKAALNGDIPIFNAIREFVVWLNDGEQWKEAQCHVWANGPEFDCAVLINAYFQVFPYYAQETAMWNYRKVQSLRTLWLLNEDLNLGCKYMDNLPKHNALFDAYREAMFVRDVLRALDKYRF